MMPYGEPITVATRTQTGVDGYGDPVYSTTSVTCKGAFAPSETGKLTDGGQLVTSQPTVLFTGKDADNVAAVVTSNSQITVRGKAYEVDGEPSDWVNPFTGNHAGITIPVKRSTGTA